MRVDLFDFELPDASIALRPAEPRDAARLLVVPADGAFGDRSVRDLPEFLRAGDVVVVNDTRVIPARLAGFRLRGEGRAAVEALLHRRAAPDAWQAFIRPAKRVAIGETLMFGEGADSNVCFLGSLNASVTEKRDGGEVLLRFELAGAALDEAIARVGHIPLPPYIESQRPADERDMRDYQTYFARDPGAVAAPTAGLHFTEGLLAGLAAKGIAVETLTLHVGAGTFLPVKADDTIDHKMHAETGFLSAAAAERLNEARAAGGRIIAVGTTSARLLETAADEAGRFHAFAGETAIFIAPGYRFRGIDALMTNFHLPRSTLFMLVSAFSGLERMKQAYAHAIRSGYRFYSYGDACLLFPAAAHREAGT